MDNMASPEHDQTLNFIYVHEFLNAGDLIVYTVLSNLKRFVIEVNAADLAGPGNLLEEFKNLLPLPGEHDSNLDDKLEDWVLDAALDFIRSVAPPLESWPYKPPTVLDYYTMETYGLKLKNEAGKLHATQYPCDKWDEMDFVPRLRVIENTRWVETPRDDKDPFISRVALEGLPRFRASEIERVLGGSNILELGNTPTKVRPTDSDKEYYFKPAHNGRHCSREIEMLSRIDKGAKSSMMADPGYAATMRTTRLVGVVMWDEEDGNDDDAYVMGLLLEYVKGKFLSAYLFHEKLGLCEVEPGSKSKWAAQMEATLRYLHSIDVVWAGVYSHYVIINEDGDAVLSHFGGGFAPTYIPWEMLGTAEADLLSLKRIKEEMNLDLSDMPPLPAKL
ncbi:hypothetical protein NPX13_g9691 [Xylaria arbuscula]|uniref:Protein kinase domain-containing protein n=1 Tax=Xylaria arbuscula TaxID=114810 RepID=A0A9W8TIT0_9PEZI|nr:hypothetical protein NPX13_g9691 [Xylaria arbuscula]